ncbi:MAG TPA: antibiotic biosynthesis monooxygenase [Caulobacteraceae bacterium]|nr:antibiotic biosynthesis monooxygenase [Caulobacteraceae bacterium]
MIMHVDVITEGAGPTLKALQDHGAAVLNAPGNLGLEMGEQTDRANHFTVHEVWASRKDYEAFAASAAGQLLRKQLMLFRGALFDDRYYEQMP